ncbi:MAG: hypothetical protein L0Z50_28165 [Verrucomicrobiales bacterium]|nr:hypothetical protein [Verrucomicrobiales bacterium]
MDPVSGVWFTFDGTANSGIDYEAQSGLLAFEPPAINQSVSVRLKCSPARFGTNYFFINLVNPSNAVVAVETAKVELISPALSLAAKPLVFTVQRTPAG